MERLAYPEPPAQGWSDPYSRLPYSHSHLPSLSHAHSHGHDHGSRHSSPAPSDSSQPAAPQSRQLKVSTYPGPKLKAKAKAYETPQPTGRYQPSRGAQRDAKYVQKGAAKAAMAAQMQQQQAEKSRAKRHHHQQPQHPQQQRQGCISEKGYGEYPYSRPASRGKGTAQGGLGLGAGQLSQLRQLEHLGPPGQPGQPRQMGQYALHQSALDNWERVRRDQQAAIAAARQAHAAELEASTRQEEERKIRRIQLQVFVHARPTHCMWNDCHAVLNSWALLEKHVYHAHLHPQLLMQEGQSLAHHHGSYGQSHSQRPCQWHECGEAFASPEECYRHVLVVHMRPFSARCPFNCLYEGPQFADLMAHIGRRHPTATPDDFVPGLIHHRPSHVPAWRDLPPLPSMSTPHKVDYLGREVKPYPATVGQRVRKSVHRNCFKGRLPRKDCYEDKRGASAAIGAIIENARRLSASVVHPLSAAEATANGEPDQNKVTKSVDEEGREAEAQMQVQAETPSAVSPGTARTMLDLVDVVKSAKLATEEAKRETSRDEDLIVSFPEDVSVAGSSPPPSRIATPVIKIKPISLILKRPKHERSISLPHPGTGEGAGAADADADATSRKRKERSGTTSIAAGRAGAFGAKRPRSRSDDESSTTTVSWRSSSRESDMSAFSEYKGQSVRHTAAGWRCGSGSASASASATTTVSPTGEGIKRSERLKKKGAVNVVVANGGEGGDTPVQTPIIGSPYGAE